jgi:hypothetical protein
MDYLNEIVSWEEVGADLKPNLQEGVENLVDRVGSIWKTQYFLSNLDCEESKNSTAFTNVEICLNLVQFFKKLQSWWIGK